MSNLDSHENKSDLVDDEQQKRFSFLQLVGLSGFWFASNFLWGALLIVLLPLQIGLIVPSQKAQIMGILLGIGAIPAIVVPLVVGALSDRSMSRFGRRRPFILGGTLLNAVSLAGLWYGGQVHSLSLLFAAYLAVQIGNNIATAAYSGVIPDLVPQSQRGIASGYMAFMTQIGTLLGGLATGLFMDSLGIGGAYALISVTLIAIIVVSWISIQETPLKVTPPPIEWGPYIKSLWIDPKQYPDFAWVWITRALVMMGFYSVSPFVQYYLGDVIRVTKPESTAPVVLGLVLIGATFSGLYGGHLSDRTGRKPIVYIANAIMVVTAIGLIFCRSLPQALIVGTIFGIGYGAYVSVDWALGTDVLPDQENAAKHMAVWHVSMTLPQTISQPVAGFLLGAFGSTYVVVNNEKVFHYNVLGYGALFLMCAGLFGLAAFLLKNVRGAR